jgi:radical SAM-linked protein
MPKYLLLFEKGESVRWLGHLDILRTFERAIRRAGLPIAFSQGFNPRERLAFASALSTGVTGAAERATLELTEPQQTDQIVAQLNAALPPGLRITQCEPLTDEEARSTLNRWDRAEYTVVCDCPAQTRHEDATGAVIALLARPQIPIEREREGKTKAVDLRPYLYALNVEPDSLTAERLTLRMAVGQGENGTARPQEVVAALAHLLPGLKARRVHRVRLLTSKENT